MNEIIYSRRMDAREILFPIERWTILEVGFLENC